MRARPDGFELEFTKPLPKEGLEEKAFAMSSFTYRYSSKYGGEEIETQTHAISAVELAADGKTVRLRIEGLRPLYVHELRTEGIVSADGDVLAHPSAYYTLNQIPSDQDR